MERWEEGDSQLFACVDALWQLMYLQGLDIYCCRCFFGSCCICKTLIFTVADTLFGTNVSATCFSSNLQMLFSLSDMYNYIYILLFLGFEDTSFANFFICIPHFPYLEDAPPWNYASSTSKNPLSQIPSSNILRVLSTSWTEPIHYLQKIDIRNSCEYGTSVGDT